MTRSASSPFTKATTLCVVVLLLLCTLTTHAQQQSAKQVYESALADYRAQHFAAAAQGFDRAYALTGQVLLLFNMGQCHRKIGEFARAREEYERYVSLASPTNDAATITEAKGYIAEITSYMTSQKPAQPVQPAPTTTKPEAKPAVAPTPTASTDTQPTVTLTTPPAEKPKRPLSHNPWLWTGVAVGVVALGLGLGLGLGLHHGVSTPSSSLGTRYPDFP